MAEIVRIMNILELLAKAGAILIACIGGYKLVFSLMSHDTNQMSSNIGLIVGGVAAYAIAGIIGGINMNFG
ncbi:hypothetical protein [Dubosiella newyorkensis]|uniref:hypothetical protein n=1 Tax=Dubosiella newyorkensis TaxID=1862672 RepID=UPI0025B5AC40|nr:hypothetical protein [Dubosiella newyorkensis]